jgi:hypothetical protein
MTTQAAIRFFRQPAESTRAFRNRVLLAAEQWLAVPPDFDDTLAGAIGDETDTVTIAADDAVVDQPVVVAVRVDAPQRYH